MAQSPDRSTTACAVSDPVDAPGTDAHPAHQVPPTVRFALCLFHYFPFGGLERDCLRVAHTLARRGHRVDIYTMAWDGPPPPPGITVHRVAVRAWRNHSRAAEFARRTRVLLQAERPALVVGFNMMAGLDVYYQADVCRAAAAASKPWWSRRSQRYRTYCALEEAVFGAHSHTLCLMLSEQQTERFRSIYHTPPARMILLPPGIDRARMAPTEPAAARARYRAELGIPEETLVTLMVGSDFRRKGVDRAITALAGLPDALRGRTQLWVVGKGCPAAYQRLARRLGVAAQVAFLGPRQDVSQLLWSSDLLLHPAYVENTGTAILEALVAGLPVLTTAACGYAMHVERAGAGRVLPEPFDAGQCSEAWAELLTSPLREEWRMRGIRYGQTEALYSMPERVADILEQLASIRATNALHQSK